MTASTSRPQIYRHRKPLAPLTIAIIIRTKDRPHQLNRCLQSLAEQKRLPDEVIVINDAGESVKSILGEYSDLPIRLIENPVNQGRARAGNLGVRLARSQVIGFLDDDDRYLPEHLLRLEKVIQHFDSKVAYSGCRVVQRHFLGEDTPLHEQVLSQFNDPYQAQRLQYENYIPLINLLIDRDLFLKHQGFDEQFEIFEDWDLLLRLSRQVGFYHLDRITTEYGVWGNQQITQSTQRSRWVQAYHQFLAKHLLSLESEHQLKLLAEYWMVSQERRGAVQNTTTEKRELEQRLLQAERNVGELQHQVSQHQRNYQALNDAHAQQDAQFQQHLQSVEQRLQTTEQTYQQDLQRHQQELKNLIQVEHSLKLQLAEITGQYQNLDHEYKTEQKQTQQQLQQREDLLHEVQRQLTLGLSQGTLHKIFGNQAPSRFNFTADDHLRNTLQQLIAWFQLRQQLWLSQQQAPQQQLQQQLHAVQQLSGNLRQELRALTDKAVQSRWLHRGGYVKILDQINILADNLTQQLQQTQAPALIAPTPLEMTFASNLPPRPLSGVRPNLNCFAGPTDALQLIESTETRGNRLFHLGGGTTLVFPVSVHCNGFSRVEMTFATYARLNPCHLRCVVREVGQSEVLRSVQCSALTVLDNQFHPFQFEPILDSEGKTYQIEIDSPDVHEPYGVAVWCQEPSIPAQFAAPPQLAITAVPDNIPAWVQRSLLAQALPAQLRSSTPEHLFIISQAAEPLKLHTFLQHLGKLCEQGKTSAQVLIWGEVSEATQAYIQQQQLLQLRHPSLVQLLEKIATSPANYLWLLENSTLPAVDACEFLAEVLHTHPKAGMIVPCLVQGETLNATYALLNSEGIMQHFPVGMPANHPYHGYRREVDAVSTPCVILQRAALKSLNFKALAAYKTLPYQLTEIIWQLRQNAWLAVYESTLRYQDDFAQRSLNSVAYLADQTVFFQNWQQALVKQGSLLNAAAWLNPKQQRNILIIDATLPTYDEDSGSLRIYTLMKILGQMGYKVTFFPDNLDSKFKYRHALEALGVEVFHGQYNIGDALSYRHFEFAIVCRVDIGQRYIPFIRLLSPETKIFYDTVDIHYVRELRQAEIENNPELGLRALDTKRKELANCLLAHRVLTVTEDDGLHLRKELTSVEYSVIPNIHELPAPATTGFAERDGIVFIGNYNHQPNEDAVYYFVENVMPKILTRIPNVKLYLVGSNMKPKMRELASANIEIVGWVDEVEPAFAQRRVFVSYLRYGAGMKGKLGQALALGLPVVSTTVGAEGMGLTDHETALIADEPESFAAAVCELYHDAALWDKLAQQGREYIDQRYGAAAVREQLAELFAHYR